MKVKFLVSMAGHSHAWNPGETHDVEAKEAARLIKAGYAVAAETGSRAKAETATKVRPQAERRSTAKAPAKKPAAKKPAKPAAKK